MPESKLGRIERRVFEHKGVEVEELIINGWGEAPNGMPTSELVWVLSPYEYTVINDKPNPCVHKEFTPDPLGDVPQVLAREKVRQQFEVYHNL